MTDNGTTALDATVGDFASDPRWRALRERDARIAANAPKVIPPCPAWCRFADVYPGANHGYDSVSDDETTYFRFHVTGNHGYYIAQDEQNRGGVVTFGPLHISGESAEELSGEDVRRMAAELIAAADRLDDIERSMSPMGNTR